MTMLIMLILGLVILGCIGVLVLDAAKRQAKQQQSLLPTDQPRKGMSRNARVAIFVGLVLVAAAMGGGGNRYSPTTPHLTSKKAAEQIWNSMTPTEQAEFSRKMDQGINQTITGIDCQIRWIREGAAWLAKVDPDFQLSDDQLMQRFKRERC